MLTLKNKITKTLLNVSLAVVIIGSGLALVKSYASAAFIIPVCQPPQVVSNSGAAGLCYDSSGKPFYPVDGNTNPDKGSTLEAGQCYVTKLTGFGLIYSNASCNQPPFNNTQVVICNDGTYQVGTKADNPDKVICVSRGGAQTTKRTTDPAAQCAQTNNNSCNQIFTDFINPAIKFLAAGVGVVVTIMIIIGGIQYATAEDDPQKLSAARTRILNALLALLVFIFLYAILQWIVPGGLF